MAYQLFTLPKQTNIDSSVRVTPGAKAYFYATTTTTPQDTYTTSALNIAHPNPVVADANGVFPSIYLNPTLIYKLTLNTSADVLIYTQDPVNDQILSKSVIGTFLFPLTAGETSAGVTPTDFSVAYPNWVNAQRYGILADGTTDDTTAFVNAINVSDETVAGAIGNSLDIAQGTSILSSTLNIRNRVFIRGRNKRGSILKASAAHPGPYLMAVPTSGVGTGSTFDNFLENLNLECSNVAGLGGVLSDSWQDGGGLRDVLVSGFRTYGVRFSSGLGGSAWCRILDCEIFGSTSGATAGIYVDSTVSLVASFGLNVHRTSVVGGGAQALLPRGIHMDGGSLTAELVHFEDVGSGIYLDGPGNHVIIGCKGSSANFGVTNVIEIAATFTGTATILGCFRNGATNLFKDNRAGGLGTISYDRPVIVIGPVADAPVVAIGANWSGGFFAGNVGSPTLAAGFNVTSITKNSTGNYTITETRARAAASCMPWAMAFTPGHYANTQLVGAGSYKILITDVAGAPIDDAEIKFGNVRLA